MRYLYTKSEHYELFLESNKSNRLSKGLKIIPTESKSSDIFKKSNNYVSEEIFNTSYETEYDMSDITNGKKAIFKTNSNAEYRIDIFPIKEEDNLINHISFTLNDDKFDIIPDNETDWNEFDNQYNKLTGKGEMIEILNRVHFILKDLVNEDIISNSFCVGGSKLEEKNDIYKYFLKVVVGESGFEKLPTKVYPEIGWGLYFKI